MKDKIVLIDGCRTPFLRSETEFLNTMTYELGQLAIKGLVSKTGIDPKEVDSVVMGCVIHTLKTSNLARESALTAGISHKTPCHTVTQACISANRAIAAAIGEIATGRGRWSLLVELTAPQKHLLDTKNICVYKIDERK